MTSMSSKNKNNLPYGSTYYRLYFVLRLLFEAALGWDS